VTHAPQHDMLKLELHVRFLNHLKLELHVSVDNHLNHGLGTLSQSVSHPAQVLRRRGFVSLTLQAVHANPPSPVFPFPPPPPFSPSPPPSPSLPSYHAMSVT